jgi:hypothetical protein
MRILDRFIGVIVIILAITSLIADSDTVIGYCYGALVIMGILLIAGTLKFVRR